MKNICLKILNVLFFLPLFAFSGTDYKKIAVQYFKKFNLSGDALVLEQETKEHILYILTYTCKDEEHPCHLGVVINKKTKAIVIEPQDEKLILEFPYSDTHIIFSKSLYEFCAD